MGRIVIKRYVLSLACSCVLSFGLANAQSGPGTDNPALDKTDCLANPSACRQIRVRDSEEGGGVQPNHPAVSTDSSAGSASQANASDRSPVGEDFQQVPTEGPTEFQRLIHGSIGKQLPLFGYDLFQRVPSTFAPVDYVPVPAKYVLGPGDELLIRGWGQLDIDARVFVDRNGAIYLPKIGSIPVAGVLYEDLPDHLRRSIEKLFRNFELRVTLGKLRSIQVLVVGYARRPGTYTVSSLSTLANALFACGGPSSRGSMRRIQVKRGGLVVAEFDLYELLLSGDKSKDIGLQPDDVIYIPPVGPQIAMTGSVNSPAVYEMKGTTILKEGLAIAGGFNNAADRGRVIIERIDNHSTRKVEEFRLDERGLARELNDGDLVRVFSISPRFEQTITLRGNVADPGRYPYRPNMKVRDLIPDREFLLTRRFWHNLNSRGTAASDDGWLPLQEPGVATGLSDFGAAMPVSAAGTGEAGESRTLRSSTGIHGQAELRNDIKRSAPDINWDYAVVQRLNSSDLSTTLIPFNLGKALLEGNESDNIALQPGDVVTIFSQYDIEVSDEHRSKFVRLEGEFVAPGVYRVAPAETLHSLIARVGGLTPEAYVFGSELSRESAKKQQQASLDRMVRELELESSHQSAYLGMARADQQQNLQGQMESQRLLVDRLREIKATGRVVLRIKPDQRDVDAFPDVPLEDGDRVFVPRQPSTVSVVGSVYNQSSFLFRDNSQVYDYLKEAGGGTRDADLKHIFIIRANGSVLSRQNTSGAWTGGLGAVRTLPGDTLVVPARLEKGGGIRALKDWSQIIAQFGIGVAAINVLK